MSSPKYPTSTKQALKDGLKVWGYLLLAGAIVGLIVLAGHFVQVYSGPQ